MYVKKSCQTFFATPWHQASKETAFRIHLSTEEIQTYPQRQICIQLRNHQSPLMDFPKGLSSWLRLEVAWQSLSSFFSLFCAFCQVYATLALTSLLVKITPNISLFKFSRQNLFFNFTNIRIFARLGQVRILNVVK